ncbi:hypothetical protein BO79DRAFT_30152 [Aspergillus costaricaensis CBS 115574]|uniref:Uncharacterized protein n=1 Tax=Aspergillus costaricaensis CBS 115574 TaxID=1448317 RepID=A0ACD1IA72_9EURO|nr:hypothetical protein BO79DRAFT_30152 [Aspergillus costaricaensis CBS 115574]RAK87354.1 hypothetical protein BO79DRAFT_30152 [Aspergillus costaricaensis CBS 115574]
MSHCSFPLLPFSSSWLYSPELYYPRVSCPSAFFALSVCPFFYFGCPRSSQPISPPSMQTPTRRSTHSRLKQIPNTPHQGLIIRRCAYSLRPEKGP